MKVWVYLIKCAACGELFPTLDNEKPDCPECGSCTKEHRTIEITEARFMHYAEFTEA